MRAMILAAGKGTRLRPLTDAVPKPLLDVAGRPMIAFALELVRAAGIREVVINLHHLGDQIRRALGNGEAYGVKITYSAEDPILDTGGGIAAARATLAGDRFVVLNADTYIELRLNDVIAFHDRSGALATLVLRPDPEAARYGSIEIGTAGRVRRFLSTVAAGAAAREGSDPEPLMYAGVMIFEPRIFTYLPDGVYSITRDVFPRLLIAGEPVHGYVHHGYWRVLDTPADLEAGRREIAQRVAGATTGQ
jgi:mannose-1-phosphate guanylyltransferase